MVSIVSYVLTFVSGARGSRVSFRRGPVCQAGVPLQIAGNYDKVESTQRRGGTAAGTASALAVNVMTNHITRYIDINVREASSKAKNVFPVNFLPAVGTLYIILKRISCYL